MTSVKQDAAAGLAGLTTALGDGIVVGIEGNAAAPVSPKSLAMHILIGIPGSGKSSFAASELGHCVHVSKDAMAPKSGPSKSERQKTLIRDSLSAGKSVVVDNTNITVELRKTLIHLAKESGVKVYG